MSDLACPVCGHVAEPAAHVANGRGQWVVTIAICASCGASLNVSLTGEVTRATALDTEALSVADLQVLRRARAAIARPTR